MRLYRFFYKYGGLLSCFVVLIWYLSKKKKKVLRIWLLLFASLGYFHSSSMYLLLPTIFIFWLFTTIYLTTSTSTISSPHSPTANPPPSTCTGPFSAANTALPPPLPNNRPYRLPDSFVYAHILVFFTDFNVNLPRAAWATYCLDQCIAYVGNGTRTCRSFEVDQGVPYPAIPKGPNGEEGDNRRRWWCEGFDVELKVEDFVENTVVGSYERFLGVNRLCDDGGKNGGEVVRDY